MTEIKKKYFIVKILVLFIIPGLNNKTVYYMDMLS